MKAILVTAFVYLVLFGMYLGIGVAIGTALQIIIDGHLIVAKILAALGLIGIALLLAKKFPL